MANDKSISDITLKSVRQPLNPKVLIHGPRQCGKATLTHMVGDSADYEYITFDDDFQLAVAQADQAGFVAT